MARSPKTQAFIDEVRNPSVQSNVQLRNYVKASLTALRGADQQVAIWRGLCQEAEEVEADTLLEGKMDALIGQFKVHQAVYADMGLLLRRLRISRGILKEQGAEFLALADTAGYVTDG